VLHTLAAELGVDLGTPDPKTIDAAIGELGFWKGDRPATPEHSAAAAPTPRHGEAILATWHYLLDEGRLQENEPHLAGTRKPAVARLSQATAAALGVAAGAEVTVSTDRGEITLPVAITELPDEVVWLPTCSPGSHVQTALGASSGAIVRVAAAPPSAGGPR
jgi:NADH-quinone oxidoreductase subunit G